MTGNTPFCQFFLWHSDLDLEVQLSGQLPQSGVQGDPHVPTGQLGVSIRPQIHIQADAFHSQRLNILGAETPLSICECKNRNSF